MHNDKYHIERLNRLSSEQMREQGFYTVESEVPKSFMMEPYMGNVPCFWYCLLAYDLSFVLAFGFQHIQPTLLLSN